MIQCQIYCINNSSSKTKEEKNISTEASVKSSKHEHKDLISLNAEIGENENCSIVEAERKKDSWNLKIKLTGDTDDILQNLQKVKEYNLKSYKITKNDDEKFILLEISE